MDGESKGGGTCWMNTFECFLFFFFLSVFFCSLCLLVWKVCGSNQSYFSRWLNISAKCASNSYSGMFGLKWLVKINSCTNFRIKTTQTWAQRVTDTGVESLKLYVWQQRPLFLVRPEFLRPFAQVEACCLVLRPSRRERGPLIELHGMEGGSHVPAMGPKQNSG